MKSRCGIGDLTCPFRNIRPGTALTVMLNAVLKYQNEIGFRFVQLQSCNLQNRVQSLERKDRVFVLPVIKVKLK